MTPARIGRLLLLTFALSLAAHGQVTIYTWTGADAVADGDDTYANFSDATNWANQQAPVSSATSTALAFGPVAGLSSADSLYVHLPATFAAYGVSFSGSMPFYTFAGGGSFQIGAGGVSLASGAALFWTDLTLSSQQTWQIDSAIQVYGAIDGTGGITKTGSGYLVLWNSDSTFTGGVDVQAGSLFVGGSSSAEASAVTNGPVGTGTLTLRNGTELRAADDEDDITLHNPITLGTNVTFGHQDERNSIRLTGNITPLNAQTTILLGAEDTVFFDGTIGNARSGESEVATTVTFTTPNYFNSLGFAVLNGANTYTGGTVADRAAVIFYRPGSIPQQGSLNATNGGYISTGFSGGMEAILARITNPSAFNGSLGFDTNLEDEDGPTTFSDAINLSSFTPDTASPVTGFWGIGSQTGAIITGAITPPTGGNYVFGGGEGTLYVQSSLTAPTGVRVRSVYGQEPLTVWLQGNNSFTGNLLSDHSVVVLDSANALPTGSSFGLDSQAYVGYTENTGFTPAQFISRLPASSYNADSVLGFDSANSYGRTISALVNLSGLNNIYIGSTTHAHLSGPIRAPAGGMLSVTGVKGGWLTIDSALTPTVTIDTAPVSGVTSLQIGMFSANPYFSRGIVELTSPNSTFAGGTTLLGGYTLVGASSTTAAGAITAGPLGTGTVTFGYSSTQNPAVLAATTHNVTLHNPITFYNYAAAQFGVSVNEDGSFAHPISEYSSYGLHLAGNLSGSAGTIRFAGQNLFQLSGNNSGLNAAFIAIGDHDGYNTPVVMAASNTALGNTASSIWLGPGADLMFNTPLPTIGTISGGYQPDDSSNLSHITLLPNSTLTIYQQWDDQLAASIGAATVAFNWSGDTVEPISASIVKTGSGELILSGQSRYSGGTTITAGSIAPSGYTQLNAQGQIISSPLGTGPVTLAGGSLTLRDGYTLHNALQFSGSNNVLGGTGVINSLVSAGTGVTIAPGNSPGSLEFAGGLTWAAGGTYSIDILSLTGTPGTDSDLITVTGGTFSITATAQDPFTLQLNSLASLSQLGPLGDLPTSPVSLVILQSNAPITGVGTNFDNFVINTTNFSSSGTFALALGGLNNAQLLLNYTPAVIPEPSTYALIGMGLLVVIGTVRRKRRNRRS